MLEKITNAILIESLLHDIVLKFVFLVTIPLHFRLVHYIGIKLFGKR